MSGIEQAQANLRSVEYHYDLANAARKLVPICPSGDIAQIMLDRAKNCEDCGDFAKKNLIEWLNKRLDVELR